MTEEAAPEAFFDLLADSAGYPDGHEGAVARYQDFRAVFLGSDQGKRVLREILGQCAVFKATPPAGRVDPYLTHVRDGRRGAALSIMGVIYNEPKPQPTAANRKDK